MEEKRFYTIQQQGRTAELAIFGPIRSIRWEENDVTAWNILQELRALDADEIHVHINCPGGNVGEAFAIYNVLREHPAQVSTYADGYVASAAIYPFLAGDRRVANPVSAFYFHPVQMEAYGGPDDLRKVAAQAELLTEQGIKAFEAAGVRPEDAKELVARDDFATPEEMLALGIATELGGQEAAENASQSILPMVAQLLREHRERKAAEQRAEAQRADVGIGPYGGAEAERDAAEAQREAEELAGGLDAIATGIVGAEISQEAETERQKQMDEDMRNIFGRSLRQMMLAVLPNEGNPVGILADGAAEAQRETEGTQDNRLGAWLGLRGAE